MNQFMFSIDNTAMISDETLAAYIDGMLSKEMASRIEECMDIDTREVVNVTRTAIKQGGAGHRLRLPDWDSMRDHGMVCACPAAPMAMAGFLGDEQDDEVEDDDDGARRKK